MRSFLLLLTLVLTAACSPRGGGDPVAVLLYKLERLGYFDHMPPDRKALCFNECLAGGTPYGESCARVLDADAEDLAEGGIASLCRRAAPLLASFGAGSAIPNQTYHLDRYTVTIDNGRVITIFDPYTTSDRLAVWQRASLLAQAILDLRLAHTSATDRFYTVYFANDQLFVLLTPEMFDAIAASSLGSQHVPRPLPLMLARPNPGMQRTRFARR